VLAKRSWNALVTILFLVLAAAFCFIAQWRYAIFRDDVDLGIFTQVIAGLGHGFSSTAEGGVNHLLVHWSPIVVTAWPFLRAFGPLGLQYFQAILVAAVLFPVWGLARARLNAAPAFAVVVVAALYPILWANAAGDFHEMAFVPVLSATLVYALDRRRWMMSLVTALLLACTKEDQLVILSMNGAIFALTARGDAPAKRGGWAISGLAIAIALAYVGVVRPWLNPHVPYLSFRFYDWTGLHAGARAFISDVVAPRSWYALIILVPLAFLPCISRYGLFLIAGFVEILAAHQPIAIVPGAQYSALLTGYALAGFVDGAARLHVRKPKLAKWAVVAAAVTSLWIGIFASPMDYWYFLYRRPNAHDAQFEATLQRLPRDADVGAEDEVFAHMGLNPRASINFAGQQWFVYDARYASPRWDEVDAPAVRQALARRTYGVKSDDDGIVVLKRDY
jgi:uncharacterized membrane protein